MLRCSVLCQRVLDVFLQQRNEKRLFFRRLIKNRRILDRSLFVYVGKTGDSARKINERWSNRRESRWRVEKKNTIESEQLVYKSTLPWNGRTAWNLRVPETIVYPSGRKVEVKPWHFLSDSKKNRFLSGRYVSLPTPTATSRPLSEETLAKSCLRFVVPRD